MPRQYKSVKTAEAQARVGDVKAYIKRRINEENAGLGTVAEELGISKGMINYWLGRYGLETKMIVVEINE